MRVLVTGSRGQLGKSLTNINSEEIDFIGSARNLAPNEIGEFVEIDITDEEGLVRAISELSPEYVVNTAALTNVDACEKDPSLAQLANAIAPRNIAKACLLTNSKMIQVSTDYVFDGEVGMYSETDEVCPIQEYGRTKLLGEQNAIDILGSDVCILRTSVVFDGSSNNFVKWVVDSLVNESEIKIVEDQWVCPTSTKYISESIIDLINYEFKGIVHVSSQPKLSRFAIARRISEILGLPESQILPITMDELNWSARRPRDSSLDCSRLGGIRELSTFEEMFCDQNLV
jgi:dTDP-4-dehydrorhamnose reductase